MTKIFEEKRETIKIVVNVSCDRCGKDCKCPLGNMEVATIHAHWGYSSGKDTEVHEAHLCEECYDEMIKIMNIKVDIQEEGMPLGGY